MVGGVTNSRFTDWPEEYAAKVMAPEAAVQPVSSGDVVAILIGSITPNLCDALFARGDELRDIDLVVCAPFVDPSWFEPDHPAFETHVELFNTSVARRSVNDGRSDFVSMPFSRKFKATRERGGARFDPDVVLLSVGPPDRFGSCSFEISMWNKASYARQARIVLAEVFDGYPRTGGANQIHVSEIDAFVPGGPTGPHRVAQCRGRAHRRDCRTIGENDFDAASGARSASGVLCIRGRRVRQRARRG